MDISKMDDESHNKNGVWNSVIVEPDPAERSGNSAKALATQQEVINDSQTNLPVNVSNSNETGVPSKAQRSSSELSRSKSRTETVKQDAAKLKSATLGRMGKMFKQRSQTPVTNKSSISDGIVNNSVENCGEEPSRKEKTNSLGRMLKLVEKDGSPRKLFNHSRAGSLSRILRRHPQTDDEVPNKTVEDPSPGIFSRMFNQLRGRPASGNSTAEPNIKTRNKMSSLPPKVPLNSRTNADSSSLSSPLSSPMQPLRTSQKSINLDYSI